MKPHTLGDVHLGKKFENGVPLHRRGDRERMQFNQFVDDLATECSLHIQMGDLFDKMVVPYSVVFSAAMAYRAAAQRNPDTTYVVLRGNHDASRDLDKVSAFQLFSELVRPFGVVVADDQPLAFDGHVIIPWHPFISAAEMVEAHADLIRNAKAVYGHWDVVMGETNQIPAGRLKALGVVEAFTGHDHNKRTMEIEGLTVHITGSMQPYSHGEDPEGNLYVTMSLLEALSGDFKDKCVRIQLMPGEDLAEPIDCLQLTLQRVRAENDADMGEVAFDAFDFQELFDQAVAEVGLNDSMRAAALVKLEEERAARA